MCAFTPALSRYNRHVLSKLIVHYFVIRNLAFLKEYDLDIVRSRIVAMVSTTAVAPALVKPMWFNAARSATPSAILSQVG